MSTTYNSSINLELGAQPIVDEQKDPVLYQELLDLHNAIEKLAGSASFGLFTNAVIVKEPSQLVGTLYSNIDYIIDGHVDMGTESIVVPPNGLRISGLGFDISSLTSSKPGHVMFASGLGNSGDLTMSDLYIREIGVGSSVFALTSATGNEAIEQDKVNYIDCVSLGYIDNYRQALESGNGRFGGTPTLELRGVWSGGYRLTTSIVRNLDNAMNAPLFKAGAGFTMASRFLSDINIDLGTTASLVDFIPANFTSSSLFQLQGCIIVRNGVKVPTDPTLIPNIFYNSIQSSWKENQGIPNTFEGGVSSISTAIATTIAVINTFYPLAGTFTPTDLDHFDAPANGRLRNLSTSPREFTLYLNAAIESTAGDILSLRVVRYNALAASTTILYTQTKEVYNFSGPIDYALFSFFININLEVNDYVYLEVANTTAATNVTADISSYYRVLKR